MKLQALVLSTALLASSVNAGMIFSDNFDSESTTSSVLNYTLFTKWDVSNGTVDYLYNYSGINCVTGGCVDLDGSTRNSGLFATKNALSFTAGQTYTVKFDLSGSQRSTQAETVSIVIDGLLNEQVSVSSDNFQTFTYSFTAAADISAVLSFQNEGGDNIGAVLDNVEVSEVPVPAAAWLFGTALLGLFAKRK